MLLWVILHWFPCLAAGRTGQRRTVLLLIALAALPGHAAAAAPPEVSARSVLLINPDTGEILYAKEPHRRLPPASTTKVLTALIALQQLDLNVRLPVSPGAARTPPSRVGLYPGEWLSALDLLYGLMLKSGNDVAEVIAEAIGGSISRFAGLMNAEARRLGAWDSHFNNPHGLPDEGHYSTAHDLAVIFSTAMENPVFAEIVRTRYAALRIETPRDADWRLVPVSNSNRLLASYEGALGGKTGYTYKAKRCFVGEAQRANTRLIVAVLGSTQLWDDVEVLFDYGFSRYGLAPPPVSRVIKAAPEKRVRQVLRPKSGKKKAAAAKKSTGKKKSVVKKSTGKKKVAAKTTAGKKKATTTARKAAGSTRSKAVKSTAAKAQKASRSRASAS
ncbi:MAG: D-alanyl-D-alanine carboxypeptidase [Pseudomonadota bacterium]|nr:D-alanyl-D-alanine carboxypeptidase [Pseudomonadota bacterium]